MRFVMVAHIVGFLLQLWRYEKIMMYPRFWVDKLFSGWLRSLLTCVYCLTPYLALLCLFIPYNVSVLGFFAVVVWTPHVVVFLNKNRVVDKVVDNLVDKPVDKVVDN